MPWWKNQIEVQKKFLVSYDCHSDVYIVDGKHIPGWKTFADCKDFDRKKIRENKQEGKVTWALRKTTEEKRLITWALKIPRHASNELFIFVNSASVGKGQVQWSFNVPKKEMMSQLSSRVVNCIKWIDSDGDFSGLGKTRQK